MDLLTTTYQDKIAGTLSCLDRVIITGTIPQICYSQGMTSYLYSQKIKIFDYAKFAEPFKEELRNNALKVAKENDIEIEFVRKTHIRKEDLVKKYWTSEVIIQAWFTYYLQWKVVTAINHGMIRKQERHF